MQKTEIKKPDLGTGSVGKLLAKLALPAVAAQITTLYNLIDRVYVGRIAVIGTDALAGIGRMLSDNTYSIGIQRAYRHGRRTACGNTHGRKKA